MSHLCLPGFPGHCARALISLIADVDLFEVASGLKTRPDCATSDIPSERPTIFLIPHIEAAFVAWRIETMNISSRSVTPAYMSQHGFVFVDTDTSSTQAARYAEICRKLILDKEMRRAQIQQLHSALTYVSHTMVLQRGPDRYDLNKGPRASRTDVNWIRSIAQFEIWKLHGKNSTIFPLVFRLA
ncbi:hypothetical protein IG631_07331 [Alternaria alternata]|nr:hypothetical protein IG631_07331 [Alternaria alternata]